MERPKILIVEDEADIRDLMVLHLSREGYTVTAVESGEAAISRLEQDAFSLAIFDWMLPGISGLDLCQKFCGKLPILMVTARAEAADIVLGLTLGADDYVVKPFDIPVFIARVRSLLRRGQRSELEPASKRLAVGSVELDEELYEVYVEQEKVALTPVEFKLLKHLMKSRYKVLPRKALLDYAQGEDITVTDRTVDVHISAIRRKLGASADIIETIRGIGYRIKETNT
jgi:two-component system phosphate regulon response regulator PhoB